MGKAQQHSGEAGKNSEPCGPNALWVVKKRHIEGVLEATRFDRAKAARYLQISERELDRWITRLGIGDEEDASIDGSEPTRAALYKDTNQRERRVRNVVKSR